MHTRLQGKKIAAIGVTAKHSTGIEPLLCLLAESGAEIVRVVCGKTCPYELHKMGYKKVSPASLASFDAVICIEFWGTSAVPTHVPLISVTHAFGAPVKKQFTLKNPHYLQHCDYYFTNSALQKENIPANFFVFSSRRTDSVCLVPISLFVFGEMQKSYNENTIKDCVFFVLGSMQVRGKIDQRIYEYIDYIIKETPYICAFRPAPGDHGHPQIAALIEHFRGHEKFVLDTNTSTNIYMQRACYSIGYKTSLSMFFSFISGKPNIEVDFTDNIALDASFRRDETGTGYLAAHVEELKSLMQAIEIDPLHMKKDIMDYFNIHDAIINPDYKEECVQCFEQIFAGKTPVGGISLPISPRPDISFTSIYEELVFFSTVLKNKTMGIYAPVLDGRYPCWDMARSVWHQAASTGNAYLAFGFSLAPPHFLFPIKDIATLQDRSFVLISKQNIPSEAQEYVQARQEHCLGWWQIAKSTASDSLPLRVRSFMEVLSLEPDYVIITGNTLEEIENCMAEFYKNISLALLELKKATCSNKTQHRSTTKIRFPTESIS